MTTPYPLLLEPVLMPKVWGGRRLERFGKRLPPGVAIGESWELADLAQTSASGGGGGAVRTKIRNGALAGAALCDAVSLWGESFLPGRLTKPSGNFPLLVKLLDARENLSIQVHPSPRYAANHPEAFLKTECWYILDAEPNSFLYKGIREGIDRPAFEALVQEGRVAEALEKVPARPGDCHNLPSGTCHALGAGVLVAEVQTPSDTTFRVDDWGRVGRELHVAQALECIAFAAAPESTCLKPGQTSVTHVITEFFRVTERALGAGSEFRLVDDSPDGGVRVLMLLHGAASLCPLAGGFPPELLSVGETVVVPQSRVAQASVVAREPSRLLVISL